MRSCRIVAGLLLVSATVTSAEKPAATTSATRHSDLTREAMVYERKGDKAKALEAYEAIVAKEPGKKLVLAPRLVRLYAETGVTNKALEWAQVAMQNNPDPQAYLAGVYTLLGDARAARGILDKEIAAASEPRRQLTLRWQLADVLEKEGDVAAAEKTLSEAADKVKGTPDESAAKRRLDHFRAKHQGGGQKNAGEQANPAAKSP
jgi:tetratricopeptide (TPR) repeat protein